MNRYQRIALQALRRLILLPGVLCLLTVTLASAAEDHQRIIKIGSDVTIAEGNQVRSVVAIGGQITVAGTVDENVTAVGGSVVLTRTAAVGGSVTALGGVVVVARDAEIHGDLMEVNSSNLFHTVTAALSSEWEGWSWIVAIIKFAIFLVILVISLLIVALMPKPIHTMAGAITAQPYKVILSGLLGLILIVPLFVLLTVSVVGIVLIPLEVIIVVCAALLGMTTVGQRIGQSVTTVAKRPRRGMVRETFWGLVILLLILDWVPLIGMMAKVIALVLGFGAVLITRFGTYRGWDVVCAPAAAQPAVPPTMPPPATTAETPSPGGISAAPEEPLPAPVESLPPAETPPAPAASGPAQPSEAQAPPATLPEPAKGVAPPDGQVSS